MSQRTQQLLRWNKPLSLFLAEVTVVMLASGYAMTFIGVDIPALRVVHFVFDFIFVVTFTTHTLINTFVLKYRWADTIGSILEGTSNRIAGLRLLQRLSSIGLIVAGLLQVITGLDWFKLGLSSLLPYPVHRETDLFLFIFLAIHLSVGYYFAQLRGQVGKKEKTVDPDRRAAITVLGGTVLGAIAALLLDNAPKVGTGITGAVGELPPGQTELERMKVLHTGIGIPPFNRDTWTFEVSGEVENPFVLSYDEFRALPTVLRSADFHCVTGWTKFDNDWEGVSFKEIMKMAELKPEARFATIECLRGYTTSLPLTELTKNDVMLAYRLDNRELPREHGGPLRLVVPHKYGYKSAKWVIKVKFTELQELGYWEVRGYSNTANPFTNDRYSSG